MYTKSGPWGGEGGSAWDDEHIGGIRQIVIQHGIAIDSIQIGYDVKGTLVWGDNHGGTGGSRTQIVIRHGAAIDSIQILYVIKGASYLGGKHGGTGGNETIISLNYPEEFLVGVSGSWGDLLHIPNVIRSLTFKSNKRTFGPYGQQQGLPFSYSAVGAKIVGFYGRSGLVLDAIGVQCEPLKAKSCLDLVLPTSFCDTNVCCQCNWSLFSCC